MLLAALGRKITGLARVDGELVRNHGVDHNPRTGIEQTIHRKECL
jgi:hypothetical protein